MYYRLSAAAGDDDDDDVDADADAHTVEFGRIVSKYSKRDKTVNFEIHREASKQSSRGYTSLRGKELWRKSLVFLLKFSSTSQLNNSMEKSPMRKDGERCSGSLHV